MLRLSSTRHSFWRVVGRRGGHGSCASSSSLYSLSVYHMYEKARPIPPDAEARIDSEARQFVEMMLELWDETRGGALSADAFDRAAHQHPLLAQAFS